MANSWSTVSGSEITISDISRLDGWLYGESSVGASNGGLYKIQIVNLGASGNGK